MNPFPSVGSCTPNCTNAPAAEDTDTAPSASQSLTLYWGAQPFCSGDQSNAIMVVPLNASIVPVAEESSNVNREASTPCSKVVVSAVAQSTTLEPSSSSASGRHDPPSHTTETSAICCSRSHGSTSGRPSARSIEYTWYLLAANIWPCAQARERNAKLGTGVRSTTCSAGRRFTSFIALYTDKLKLSTPVMMLVMKAASQTKLANSRVHRTVPSTRLLVSSTFRRSRALGLFTSPVPSAVSSSKHSAPGSISSYNSIHSSGNCCPLGPVVYFFVICQGFLNSKRLTTQPPRYWRAWVRKSSGATYVLAASVLATVPMIPKTGLKAKTAYNSPARMGFLAWKFCL
mmetsp:Transcript_33791/g.102091  ORF Transcript_33791/g.102091 Transcript_33791/m.102091 type:complete len:344 (+) Transcript_33791:170-1201(+)